MNRRDAFILGMVTWALALRIREQIRWERELELLHAQMKGMARVYSNVRSE